MGSVDHELKERLRKIETEGGKVQIGSGVMGDAPSVKAIPVTGDVQASVPKVANADPLINKSTASTGQVVTAEAEKSSDAASGDIVTNSGDSGTFTAEQITISDDDRNAFLNSLVSGKRFERKTTLFGGQIKLRIRCRSTEESEAIASYMNAGVREEKYASPLEYAIAIRNALLAAQVVELNETRFPELAAPLFRTQDGDKITQPGWLEAAAMWSKKPETVVTAIYEELRIFEKKYWTMIAHARDQNFWHPEESI